MARPVTRPATIVKTMKLEADLVEQVEDVRGDEPFTHFVEGAIRRELKARKRAKKAPSEA